MPSQQGLGFQHMKIRGKQTFSPLPGSYSNSIFNFLCSHHTVLHVPTLFYFPTSSAQEFLFFHILANNCYFLGFFFLAVAILVSVRYYLTVILTYISLVNNDGEHFFICSLVICISSLEKCLVKSIVHFEIRWLLLLWLLSCRSSLYVLDSDPFWSMMGMHAQSSPTLCDPMDCSPPSSSSHGIFQARILE